MKLNPIITAVVSTVLGSMATYVCITSANFLLLPVNNNKQLKENRRLIEEVKTEARVKDSMLSIKLQENFTNDKDVVNTIKNEFENQRNENKEFARMLNDIAGFLKAKENYYGLAKGNDSTALRNSIGYSE